MFVRHPVQVCLELSIFIFLAQIFKRLSLIFLSVYSVKQMEPKILRLVYHYTSNNVDVLLCTLPRLDVESDQAAFLRQEILLHTGHCNLKNNS